MRSVERQINSVGLSYCLSALVMGFSVPPGYLVTAVILGSAYCYWYEGIRLHQLPGLLGALISSLMKLLLGEGSAGLLDIVALGMFILSLTLVFFFGEADFSRLHPTGPYQAGFKEFSTSHRKNEVSVFYPITRRHFTDSIQLRNTPWLRHGDHTIQGLARASGKNAYGG